MFVFIFLKAEWQVVDTLCCMTRHTAGVSEMTVWHNVAPGLGERSTACPGQFAWSALNDTLLLLENQKGLDGGKFTHTKIKQTNKRVKKKEKSDHSCISIKQDFFFFFFFFSPLISPSLWFCKSSPPDHQSLMPVLVWKVCTHTPVFLKVVPHRCCCGFSFFHKKKLKIKSIFSGSCQQQPQDSLYGS